MQELKLPHIAPIRFAKKILTKEGNFATVLIEFETIATLPMLVEAAAQSSAAFRVDDSENGFLASIKGVKLFQKPSSLSLIAKIEDAHRLDAMRYVNFEIFQEDILIASGTLVIVTT